LRLLVRICMGELAVATDLPTTRPPNASPLKIEGALSPGQTFYIWLQGWVQCTGTCVPADNATHGVDCECLDVQPAQQIQRSEFCTTWEKASGGRTQVTAVLRAVTAGTCPPPPLFDCAQP